MVSGVGSEGVKGTVGVMEKVEAKKGSEGYHERLPRM